MIKDGQSTAGKTIATLLMYDRFFRGRGVMVSIRPSQW